MQLVKAVLCGDELDPAGQMMQLPSPAVILYLPASHTVYGSPSGPEYPGLEVPFVISILPNILPDPLSSAPDTLSEPLSAAPDPLSEPLSSVPDTLPESISSAT